MPKLRAMVYVDGFNFYFGALKKTKLKWLDLSKYFHFLFDAQFDIDHILYATAWVKDYRPGMNVKQRQTSYIRALETLKDVEIVYGRYTVHDRKDPLVNYVLEDEDGSECLRWPRVNVWDDTIGHHHRHLINHKYDRNQEQQHNLPTDYPRVHVIRVEEKGSDVTLGARMVFDACSRDIDTLILASNDTDLLEPIRLVREELGKQVIQVCPTKYSKDKKGRSVRIRPSSMKDYVDSVIYTYAADLQDAQFPDIVDGRINKPKEW